MPIWFLYRTLTKPYAARSTVSTTSCCNWSRRALCQCTLVVSLGRCGRRRPDWTPFKISQQLASKAVHVASASDNMAYNNRPNGFRDLQVVSNFLKSNPLVLQDGIVHGRFAFFLCPSFRLSKIQKWAILWCIFHFHLFSYCSIQKPKRVYTI